MPSIHSCQSRVVVRYRSLVHRGSDRWSHRRVRGLGSVRGGCVDPRNTHVPVRAASRTYSRVLVRCFATAGGSGELELKSLWYQQRQLDTFVLSAAYQGDGTKRMETHCSCGWCSRGDGPGQRKSLVEAEMLLASNEPSHVWMISTPHNAWNLSPK